MSKSLNLTVIQGRFNIELKKCNCIDLRKGKRVLFVHHGNCNFNVLKSSLCLDLLPLMAKKKSFFAAFKEPTCNSSFIRSDVQSQVVAVKCNKAPEGQKCHSLFDHLLRAGQ